MRLENTLQEIRDNSFIQNHSRPFRFPAPWRCFFSSVHLTHFLQGSDQRTGMAIAEAWFSAQWPNFVLIFEVCVWIIVSLEDPNMAHYTISNRISHLFIFYQLVFDRIHDAMCLNKMSRTSNRNIGSIKNTAVYFIVHMGYFLSLCSPNPSWVFAAKKLIFCFIWP